ncbi:MAG: alpha/beta hydrolase [Flavobacterium sp.]|nr:alpha/beta hydrolase [Flavobacterium sp.]
MTPTPVSFYYKNTPISYTDSGKGSALVLLHGFLENQGMWNELVAVYKQKYRVITLDLLGHGNSGCLGYVHSMEDQADVVHELLSQLRIRKAIVVGHSMGGYVALALAEAYPEIFKGLVLLNSTARADSAERKLNRDRAVKAVKKDHQLFINLSIANLFSETNRERLAPTIELVKKAALETPLQGIIAALEGMKIRKDREVLLHFAPFPMLLILGTQDPVLPFESTKDQVEQTHTKLVCFEGGHMTQLENPDELCAALTAFFKSV